MRLVDLIGRLPIHATKQYASRPIESVTRIAIHHTAGPETQTPEQIARYHISPRPGAPDGWPGIAYHYLVGADGTVYKCWPSTTITYCVARGNTPTLCICLIGNREESSVPVVQWDAAVELVRELLGAYPGIVNVYGHREVPTNPPQTTACPGKWVSMSNFRREVGIA